METPKRARKRKLDTAKADLKPLYSHRHFGRQGVRREAESEGLAENHRVVINGSYPRDEPVGQRWGMVEPALWRRRRMVPPHRTTVCAGDTVGKRRG